MIVILLSRRYRYFETPTPVCMWGADLGRRGMNGADSDGSRSQRLIETGAGAGLSDPSPINLGGEWRPGTTRPRPPYILREAANNGAMAAPGRMWAQ